MTPLPCPDCGQPLDVSTETLTIGLGDGRTMRRAACVCGWRGTVTRDERPGGGHATELRALDSNFLQAGRELAARVQGLMERPGAREALYASDAQWAEERKRWRP